MAKAYSSDLRERVVEAVNEGATRYEAAERFGVSVSSAVAGIRTGGTREVRSQALGREPLAVGGLRRADP